MSDKINQQKGPMSDSFSITSAGFPQIPSLIQIPSDFSEVDLKKKGLEPLKTLDLDGSRSRSLEPKTQSDSILLKTLQNTKVEVEEAKQMRISNLFDGGFPVF